MAPKDRQTTRSMRFTGRLRAGLPLLLVSVLSCGSVTGHGVADLSPSPAVGQSPAAEAPKCRLPVSGFLPGSGGFVRMPGGTFTLDPASNIPIPGQVDQSGLRRGYTYDRIHSKWLPVPRDWVMPDFSSYVYIGTEVVNLNQHVLHWVDVTTRKDTVWPNGNAIYGTPTLLRPEGVYGAPGPEIFVMVDPTGFATTLDQGHDGLFEVVTSSAYYAANWTTSPGGQYIHGDVYRIDARTAATTLWFHDPAVTEILPIGADSAGHPIIAGGMLSPRTNRMMATQIWIASAPSTGDQPQSQLIYSDPANPLTIQGPPIVSAGAIWFETDQGLYVFTKPTGGFRLASSFSGYISGGCL
jgi:hypothetical protein